MNAQRVGEFFEKMSQSPDALKEFVDLAARHGIDVSDDQLSEAELANVSGGTGEANDALQGQMQGTQASVEEAAAKSKALFDLQKYMTSNWPIR